VKSGDRSGQSCRPPRPIHRAGICSFRYTVTCRLKCGVPRHPESTSVIVFFVVWIIFNFCPQLRNSWESDSSLHVSSDWEMTSGIRSWSIDTQSPDILCKLLVQFSLRKEGSL
jgi:hypothetical protein